MIAEVDWTPVGAIAAIVIIPVALIIGGWQLRQGRNARRGAGEAQMRTDQTARETIELVETSARADERERQRRRLERIGDLVEEIFSFAVHGETDRWISAQNGSVEGRPKTEDSERVVNLPPFLRDLMAEHIAAYSDPTDRSAYIFSMKGGGPGRKEGDGGPLRVGNWRRRDFQHAVESMLQTIPDRDRRQELERFTPHDLRDTAATLALKAGASLREVSIMLGHSDPAMTIRRYVGVLESMSEATEDRLGEMYRSVAPPSEAVAAAAVVPLR